MKQVIRRIGSPLALTLALAAGACSTKDNKADTLAATKAFLTYTASEDGQKQLTAAQYAPIPAEIITKVRSTVANLS